MMTQKTLVFLKVKDLFLLSVLSACIQDPPKKPLIPPLCEEAACTSVSQKESEVFRMVNQHRKGNGQSELAWESRIAQQARDHSAAVASGQRPFGHDNFLLRMKNIREFMNARTGAENIAQPHPSNMVKSTFDLWIQSPGHKKNLEGDFTHAGVGMSVHDKTPIVSIILVRQ